MNFIISFSSLTPPLPRQSIKMPEIMYIVFQAQVVEALWDRRIMWNAAVFICYWVIKIWRRGWGIFIFLLCVNILSVRMPLKKTCIKWMLKGGRYGCRLLYHDQSKCWLSKTTKRILRKIGLKRPYTQLNWAILLCDVIPDGKTE